MLQSKKTKFEADLCKMVLDIRNPLTTVSGEINTNSIDSAYFRRVLYGFVNPTEIAAEHFPFAMIWDNGDSITSIANYTAVQSFTSTYSTFLFINEPDAMQAYKTLHELREIFLRIFQTTFLNCENYAVAQLTAVDMTTIFKTALQDIEFYPPYWGIRIDISLTVNGGW